MKKIKVCIIFLFLILVVGVVYWKKETLFNHTTPLSSNEAYVLSEVRQGASFGQPLIGGAFKLVDHEGRLWTDKDFRGRWLLVYFGYAFCPDICPMALENLGEVLKKLGPRASQVQVVFITVDPARDTPDNLKKFLENFDSRIIALTGKEEEVQTAMSAYRVHAAKVDNSNPHYYAMDHTSLIYVMSPRGQYVTSFNHETPPDQIVEALRKVF